MSTHHHNPQDTPQARRARLLDLCAEYVELVEAMDAPALSYAERHALDQQRQTTHNELNAAAGIDRSTDGYRWAKARLRAEGRL